MDDCTFCKIIKGDFSSYTIYEDDIVKVFLSIDPIHNGHALIVPKKHYKDLVDIDMDVLSHINNISKKMYDLLYKKLHFKGLQIVQNNGSYQDIKHYHMHLIPDYDNETKQDVASIYDLITK